MGEQPMTDEELWKAGERYTQRLADAEAVCDKVRKWRNELDPVTKDMLEVNVLLAHDAYLAGVVMASDVELQAKIAEQEAIVRMHERQALAEAVCEAAVCLKEHIDAGGYVEASRPEHSAELWLALSAYLTVMEQDDE